MYSLIKKAGFGREDAYLLDECQAHALWLDRIVSSCIVWQGRLGDVLNPVDHVSC